MVTAHLEPPDQASHLGETFHVKGILQRIGAIQSLPADWNGPHTQKISLKAVENARTFSATALAHESNRLPFPHVSPTASGGISFEWTGDTTDRRELVLFFLADGQIDFVAANDVTGFEVSGRTKKPIELLPHLTWLVHGS